MDDLAALIEQAREGGLTVELVTEGSPSRSGRRGPVRVPDRAGGADQHAQACGPGARPRRRPLRRPRASSWRSRTTALPAARRATRATAGHGLAGCASASRSTAASSTPAIGLRAAIVVRASLPLRGEHRRPDRRRPGAGARRLPDDARGRGRHRGGGRGGQRRAGRPERAAAPARRRADGHPDARARRDRRDPADRGRGGRTRRRVLVADDVRPRRVRLRRARRRRQRVPAQGRSRTSSSPRSASSPAARRCSPRR